MDDFNPDEPLNLIKKKKPVAIVAPSPVSEEAPAQLAESELVASGETMVAAGGSSADDEEQSATAGSPLALVPDDASCQPLRGAVAPMYASAAGDQMHQQALAANSYVNSMLAAGYLNNNTSSVNNNNNINVYGAAPPYAYGGFASVAATATAATVAALTAYSPYADPALINLWAQQAQQRFYEVINLYGGGGNAGIAGCAVKPEQSMAAAAVESKDAAAVAVAKDRWRMFEYMLGFQQNELNVATAPAQSVSEPLRVSVPSASASDGAEFADSEQLSPKKHGKGGTSGKMKKHHQRYLVL